MRGVIIRSVRHDLFSATGDRGSPFLPISLLLDSSVGPDKK